MPFLVEDRVRVVILVRFFSLILPRLLLAFSTVRVSTRGPLFWVGFYEWPARASLPRHVRHLRCFLPRFPFGAVSVMLWGWGTDFTFIYWLNSTRCTERAIGAHTAFEGTFLRLSLRPPSVDGFSLIDFGADAPSRFSFRITR